MNMQPIRKILIGLAEFIIVLGLGIFLEPQLGKITMPTFAADYTIDWTTTALSIAIIGIFAILLLPFISKQNPLHLLIRQLGNWFFSGPAQMVAMGISAIIGLATYQFVSQYLSPFVAIGAFLFLRPLLGKQPQSFLDETENRIQSAQVQTTFDRQTAELKAEPRKGAFYSQSYVLLMIILLGMTLIIVALTQLWALLLFSAAILLALQQMTFTSQIIGLQINPDTITIATQDNKKKSFNWTRQLRLIIANYKNEELDLTTVIIKNEGSFIPQFTAYFNLPYADVQNELNKIGFLTATEQKIGSVSINTSYQKSKKG
ncbi:MAG: hypothetical protein V1777_03605 [Candidatus Micrarchaeota archaeon]